jgi:hypothetical protein
MSDKIKTEREWILDDLQSMDEVCADYDRSWSDALIDWIFVLNDRELQHRLSKSTHYRDILLRDFFLCGDFDATLGIIVEAFKAGDVHHLRAENERLRARVEVLEKHLGLMIANNMAGSFESEGLATDRAIAVLPDWEEKATGYTRLQLDAAAQIVGLHDEEAKP